MSINLQIFATVDIHGSSEDETFRIPGPTDNATRSQCFHLSCEAGTKLCEHINGDWAINPHSNIRTVLWR